MLSIVVDNIRDLDNLNLTNSTDVEIENAISTTISYVTEKLLMIVWWKAFIISNLVITDWDEFVIII